MKRNIRWLIYGVTLFALLRVSTAKCDDDKPEVSPAMPIDVGLITEPTAHHRTGYLNVLASIDGIRRVAVVDATGATLEDARQRVGKRFYGNGFQDAEQMLKEVRPALTVVTMEGVHAPNAVIAALR